MYHGNAPSTVHARGWVVASAVAALAATTLAAQQVPDYESIHIVPGARRDAKAETQMQAGWAGGPRSLRVYRVAGSIEGLFNYYHARLGGELTDTPEALEPPDGGNSSINYHLAFHAFDDQCMDAPEVTAPASAGTACRRWRHGRDKKEALSGSRIAYDFGRWIEVATFMWLHREPNGQLQRVRVEIRDIGLSQSWSQHMPLAQLILESVSVPPGGP